METIQKHQIWDEFLAAWPIARLQSMTLEEYTLSGSKDSFCYWVEARTQDLGSIWGGSAFKFGVFHRARDTGNADSEGTMYSNTHAWYRKYGNSAEEAFAKVRHLLSEIATASSQGLVAAIQKVDFSPAIKWKVAFLYQNRSTPTILNLYKQDALQYLAFDGDKSQKDLAEAHRLLLSQKPKELDLFDFTDKLWSRWVNKEAHVSGLVCLASQGNWMDHDISTLHDGQKAVLWWSKMPTGTESTLAELKRTLENYGSFSLYIGRGTKAEYEFKISDFATEFDYGSKDWSEAISYQDSFAGYEDGGRSAKIAFLAIKGEKLSGDLSLKDFVYWNADVPRQNNLQPVTGIKKSEPSETSKPAKSLSIATPQNIIYYGPPGTGKTYRIQSTHMGEYGDIPDQFRFITFHQSYSYEDFVEGIRPSVDSKTGQVIYEVKPGVLAEICEAAKQNPELRYGLFIDEINRGNISKIFGELISLIEIDKRTVYDAAGNLQSGLEVMLPYSRQKFGVPKNLDIIGTMNTADRSIALLDTALRRRFEFIELMPDSKVIPGNQGDGQIPDGEGGLLNLRQLLDSMNRRIQFLAGRDLTIGHAFFHEVKGIYELKKVVLKKVIPLLQEYFYDDWKKIQLVFADLDASGGVVEYPIITSRKVRELEVLGYDHPEFEDSTDFYVTSESDLCAQSFRKIYQAI